jgi:hypothetical protein
VRDGLQHSECANEAQPDRTDVASHPFELQPPERH